MQVYDIAHALSEPDINVIMGLSVDIYRGWVIWFDKRRKENERRARR